MDRTRSVSAWVWKVALAFSAAIWGSSFVVVKGALDNISPAWLLAMRFALTTIILSILFRGTLRVHLDAGHVRKGIILGLASSLGFITQFVGLAGTTPAKSAFLSAIYCVLTPFLNWAIVNRKPAGAHVGAALLAITGIGFISFGAGFSFTLNAGDLITLAAAFFFALHIVLVPRYAEGRDIMTLTIVQIACSAVVALVWALLFEAAPDFAHLDPGVWMALAYIVIMASCIAMVVQNVGQAHVEPATAALLLSLESVFAAILSVIFYHEQLTARLIIGFALIFIAVVVSEVLPTVFERRR